MKPQSAVFEFVRFDEKLSAGRVDFYYKAAFINGSTHEFKETLFLPKAVDHVGDDKREVLRSVLQSLHIMLGISYWKLYCPATIKISNFSISKKQAQFWNTVYRRGLGEFFYKNKIDFRGLVRFPATGVIPTKVGIRHNIRSLIGSGMTRDDRALVAVGGGKDSIVTAQLLKRGNRDFTAFTLNTHPIQDDVIKTLGVDRLIVRREIDPKLFKLVREGKVFDGHVPISAIYSFVALLVCILYDFKYIIFSNERSASYGNIRYLGSEINHQWSKSDHFEGLFQNYVQTFITPSVQYFSMLRPFFEIEIVRRFVKHKKFFSKFSSCNTNFKISSSGGRGMWCCRCAKCAFIFVLLSAFISKKDLLKIYGKNLFDDRTLVATYRQLLGLETKPFDCVGTAEETRVAFFEAHKSGQYDGEVVMEMFAKEVLPKITDVSRLRDAVFSYGIDSNIPLQFRKIMK